VRLRALDKDMRRLLMSWFDIGFLEMRRITWEAPAALLERLIEYEAVHEILSWTDLKNRLGSDRRCYAFFHPSMPDEPLIFVQVALVSKLSDNVQVLLDVDAPVVDEGDANTAIFYSITNTQAGLKGVSLGDFLIKRVVSHVMRDLPGVKTFSTLSPIPGFMAYLNARPDDQLLTAAEQAVLESVAPNADFKTILSDPQWSHDDAICTALKGPLSRLCAQYLVEEKRAGRSLDPVANFHLNNGANLERINWLADRSDKGMRDSAGMMVNYLYQLKLIESNHEAYRETGTIKISSAVQVLMK
jgi:malonyl-CoA decarboxylase